MPLRVEKYITNIPNATMKGHFSYVDTRYVCDKSENTQVCVANLSNRTWTALESQMDMV